MMLISDAYLALQRQMHADKPHSYGAHGVDWQPQIAKIVKQLGCADVIDYGCGKASLSRGWVVPCAITAYDPAVEEFSDPPSPADLVVCTDCLEHVEPDSLTAVLNHIEELAGKAVFLVIHTGLAAKHLPDGRNAHLIVERPNWWLQHLLARWDVLQATVFGDGFLFVGAKR